MLAFCIPQAALAAAPVNDLFANATQINGASADLAVNTTKATLETDEDIGDVVALGRHSVWYRWTAHSTGILTLSSAESSFDTVLSVFVGTTLGNLSFVDGNNDVKPTLGAGADTTSKVTTNVIAGVTYRISLNGWPEEPPRGAGPAQLHLTFASTATPPVNDAFASALPIISGDPNALSWQTSGASTEPGECRLLLAAKGTPSGIGGIRRLTAVHGCRRARIRFASIP